MKVTLVAGTRPEVVKLAPVRAALRRRGADVEWIATGQHTRLADQAMEVFGLEPDKRLDLDWDGAALTSLTAGLTQSLGAHFAAHRPDLVLVQGDTASAFSGALASFLQSIPVGHVEAGLRSGDLAHPFPEEGFRKLIAPVADLHFAPTRLAARQLRQEGVSRDRIRVTGNTVIDAVRQVASLDERPDALNALRPDEQMVLVTLHRRENWDDGVDGVCRAILRLRDDFPAVRFFLPVHLNPRVRGPIEQALGGQARIELIEPLAYPEFVALMKRARLILTDSGGVQEEAPSFGVPVLVLRNKTERNEAIRAGVARLVGASEPMIYREASLLLGSPRAHQTMARRANPFGDGRAAERIAETAIRFAKTRPSRAAPSEARTRAAAAALSPVGQ